MTVQIPDRAKLKEVFDQFDEVHSQLLYTDQCIEALHLIGFPQITNDEFLELVGVMKPDYDAQLNLDEFVHLVYILLNSKDNKDFRVLLFLLADKNISGTLTQNQVSNFLANLE